MDLLSDWASSWADYYESSRNDNDSVIDNEMTTGYSTPADGIVFALLETLSVLGLVGNTVFLYVIFRHKHHHKPSYILLSSLAFADIVHCMVMATYFYPPIVTKINPFAGRRERWASRAVMSVEWAAWGVTLSHMFALSADRFVAVSCCYRYPKLVTPHRALAYVSAIWIGMTALTVGILIQGHCCLIIPAPGYYTFTFEKAPPGTLNIYQKIFVPFESLTVGAVGVITPMTLMKYCLLRRRLKRDRSGGRNGGHHRISLSKRESRVLLQIACVTLIFVGYMINYYLFYYIVGLTTKWETLFNSLFYCFNSMVHPFIYFGFNRLLRKQLIECGRGFFSCFGHGQNQILLSGRATPSGGGGGGGGGRGGGGFVSSPRSTNTNWSQRFRSRVSGWRNAADNGIGDIRRSGSSFRKSGRFANRNSEKGKKRKNTNQPTATFEMGPLNQNLAVL